jgi:TRAP-type C4-dicarboxylate transport system substrate-binding protein
MNNESGSKTMNEKIPSAEQESPVAHERRRLTKRLLAGAAGIGGAAAIGAMPGVSRSQPKVQLKLSHYLPPSHGLHTDFMEPWAREVESKSQGAVAIQLSPGTSSLGQAQNQLEQVRNGIVDIAFGICGLPRGRMTRSTIIEMPMLVRKAEAGSRALWNLYPQMLGSDYEGIRPLVLMTHNGGLVHTRDKPIRAPEDLRGLRIRTPSPTISMMLEFLGASPVGMPPGQVYENMQRGVLDGAAFPWDPVRAFKLGEVSRFHCDLGLYTAAFWFGMNDRKYRSLPEDIRKVIDQASGQALLARIQGWWDKWDDAGKASAVERGNTIVTFSPEERARWEKTLVPLQNKAMIDFEKQGVAQARDIYIAMQREVTKVERT